ncbi:Asr1405/Asl0597 family protein [Scytonema millei]|uniref:Asr1405/Asl0597 family protein n=1 Tax=Scytonema millei TaxID=1245922 RepID=UPI0035ABE488
MKPLGCEPEVREIVEVKWADRWQVYQRLQELEISCWCDAGQPLKVEIADPTTAVQLSSVLKQFTASRQDLVGWLKQCW